MARLLFLIPHSTEEPERAAVALATAAAAGEAGHHVALWLSGEGVRLGVPGVAAALGTRGPRPAAESLQALTALGTTIYCSRPCFSERGFAADALVPGARLQDLAGLAALAADGWVPIPT